MLNKNNNSKNNNEDLSSSINQDENQLNSNIFENLAFVYDKCINLKRKNELIKIIKKNGGKSCYSCFKATHLITTVQGYVDKTEKVQQALSLGIPILVKEYIHSCVSKKELLPVENYLASSSTSNNAVLSVSQDLVVNTSNSISSMNNSKLKSDHSSEGESKSMSSSINSNTITKECNCISTEKLSNTFASVGKVDIDEKKTTTTKPSNNSSPIITLNASEDINGNGSSTTAQLNQQVLEAENQAINERIKMIEHEFESYRIAKEKLVMEKDTEIKQLLEIQRKSSILKESLFRDLENRCKEVIDLEFILEEYKARNVKLTDRLERYNNPSGHDEEKMVIQTKLDEMTSLKLQLNNENIQLCSEIRRLKKLHTERDKHIIGSEKNKSTNQETQSKVVTNHQNAAVQNEGIKNELEGAKSKESENFVARIARFFRCGSAQLKSKSKSNNSVKNEPLILPGSQNSQLPNSLVSANNNALGDRIEPNTTSNSKNSSSPLYKNNNTSPLVPPQHLPQLPVWRYKYISAVLPTSKAKPSQRVQNL
ncbi:hypothetical protein DICPUDRAFT_76955 [Dictyostelium purpureum]|uniref:BRCT domain-containing protein n=1 Tax=Dictyostelium purpureum TaxID=5786 RepID=F0ZF62_DICPU|nr:uncharacterized protein DICPUDRAFT_76955 [Dictyostelium purpureum]EGC37397.1 hypothetical protein DICPUDRAFT_76955 [Dictyostelium purpureum]|eukprot:XP_003286050.1 hypothetical protein DICPUDRAFT_76955 [Dictyostelium purpureum]